MSLNLLPPKPRKVPAKVKPSLADDIHEVDNPIILANAQKWFDFPTEHAPWTNKVPAKVLSKTKVGREWKYELDLPTETRVVTFRSYTEDRIQVGDESWFLYPKNKYLIDYTTSIAISM